MGVQSELNKVLIAGATAGATIRKAKEESAQELAKQEKEAEAIAQKQAKEKKAQADKEAKEKRARADAELKADIQKEKQARAEYLKTPQGRFETAYNKLKEQELNKRAEQRARRVLQAEAHLTERQDVKRKYHYVKKRVYE